MLFNEVHTAQDLLDVLMMVKSSQDLNMINVVICGSDDLTAVDLHDRTLTDGSKVYDLFLLR